MRIRQTRREDLPLLPAIERSAASLFADQPGLEYLAEGEVLGAADHAWSQAGGWHWLAELDGTPRGFACGEPQGGCLHLRELSVHRGAQGQGLGRALLDTVIAAGRHAGVPAVTLTTFRTVPWNAPFYARAGFRMLDAAHASPELQAILEGEAAHGMPAGSRCAMRLDLA